MIVIENKEGCCGCGACKNVCPKNSIRMKADFEGFLYPEVDSSTCIECGICEKVCPIIQVEEEKELAQRAFLIQHKDKQIRHESTSGGSFTAMADYVLREGGVVFGAAFDESFRVVHIYTESRDDLWKFRNSKYVQSDTKDTFSEAMQFLKDGRLVLYSGTPCQIEALIRFLRKPYENLLTVDFVCRGAPSPLVLEKHLEVCGGIRDIKDVKFRDKKPFGYEYSQMSVSTSKHTYYAGSESDYYLRAYFKNISDRPSCYECRFRKQHRVSDVTVWDCFHIHKLYPQMDDNTGVTRALTHTEKGVNLIKAIEDDCIIKELPAEQVVAGGVSMYRSPKKSPVRDAFFEDLNRLPPKEVFKKYLPMTFRIRAERTIRRITEHLGFYKYLKRGIKKLRKRKT